MKALKIVLMAVGVLAALFFIIAAFLPSRYTVERSIEINKAPEVVFEQVADFNNYLKWNPWSKMEPRFDLSPLRVTEEVVAPVPA